MKYALGIQAVKNRMVHFGGYAKPAKEAEADLLFQSHFRRDEIIGIVGDLAHRGPISRARYPFRLPPFDAGNDLRIRHAVRPNAWKVHCKAPMYFYVFSCIVIYMTSTKRSSFAKTLDNFRRQEGLTQDDLARQLRVSQPHISRILSGEVSPGTKLRLRVARLLAAQQIPRQHPEWAEKVAEAAGRSAAFRRLVGAALQMLEKN
jgi:DNA-binding XRE family transcriptional regulator